MPDNLPAGLFAGIVVLQVLVAVALLFFIVRIRKAIRDMGLPGNPFKAYKQIQQHKDSGPE